MAEVEKIYLSMILQQTRGRIREAATLAGVSQKSLYNMMLRTGLTKEQFKKNQP